MNVDPRLRTSRRSRAARALDAAGVTGALARLPHRPSLIVLNYHRIGDAAASPHYRGLFSATAEAFDAQIGWLQSHFNMVTLDEAIGLIDRPRRDWPSRASVLVTFDDGYRDNHDIACQILRERGVQGTFFLTTGFIGTSHVPWWDVMAYAVRKTPRKRLRLPAPYAMDVSLEPRERDAVLEALLRVCKSAAAQEQSSLLMLIQDALDVAVPGAPQLFMGWREAAALIDAGMAIGAHTHSHPILSRLPRDGQQQEIDASIRRIEAGTGQRPRAFAYPEGARESFSRETQELLAEARIDAAFSYYGGVNAAGHLSRFDVRRIPVVSGLATSLFRLRLMTAAIAGRALI